MKIPQGCASGNRWYLLLVHKRAQNLWTVQNKKLLILWEKSRDTDTLTFLTILDGWLVNQQTDVTAQKEGLSVRQGFRRGEHPYPYFLKQPDGKCPALLVSSSQLLHAEWQTDTASTAWCSLTSFSKNSLTFEKASHFLLLLLLFTVHSCLAHADSSLNLSHPHPAHSNPPSPKTEVFSLSTQSFPGQWNTLSIEDDFHFTFRSCAGTNVWKDFPEDMNLEGIWVGFALFRGEKAPRPLGGGNWNC